MLLKVNDDQGIDLFVAFLHVKPTRRVSELIDFCLF